MRTCFRRRPEARPGGFSLLAVLLSLAHTAAASIAGCLLMGAPGGLILVVGTVAGLFARKTFPWAYVEEPR